MASLDFIYDLTKTLRSQGIDFFLITFQDNKKVCQVNAFIELNNRYTIKTLVEIRDRIDGLIEAEQKKQRKDK